MNSSSASKPTHGLYHRSSFFDSIDLGSSSSATEDEKEYLRQAFATASDEEDSLSPKLTKRVSPGEISIPASTSTDDRSKSPSSLICDGAGARIFEDGADDLTPEATVTGISEFAHSGEALNRDGTTSFLRITYANEVRGESDFHKFTCYCDLVRNNDRHWDECLFHNACLHLLRKQGAYEPHGVQYDKYFLNQDGSIARVRMPWSEECGFGCRHVHTDDCKEHHLSGIETFPCYCVLRNLKHPKHWDFCKATSNLYAADRAAAEAKRQKQLNLTVYHQTAVEESLLQGRYPNVIASSQGPELLGDTNDWADIEVSLNEAFNQRLRENTPCQGPAAAASTFSGTPPHVSSPSTNTPASTPPKTKDNGAAKFHGSMTENIAAIEPTSVKPTTPQHVHSTITRMRQDLELARGFEDWGMIEALPGRAAHVAADTHLSWNSIFAPPLTSSTMQFPHFLPANPTSLMSRSLAPKKHIPPKSQ